MKLTDKKVLAEILSQHHLWAQKRLGQNFLSDFEVLQKIVQTAEINHKDYVVEVGAGIGTLTDQLCQNARWVMAVEVDPNMVKILQETCGHYLNLKIIQKNILGLELNRVLGKIAEYKVVANLPYYITQPVLRYFLENETKPESMVLMVQKEVAERLCAKPGEMSLLSVSVQFFGQPKLIQIVKAESFFPAPKVDSAIIRINKIRERFLEVSQPLFFTLVKAGFSERRKQIHNSLATSLQLAPETVQKILTQAEIDPTRRAQTLSMEEWHELYQAFTREQT
ncbi:MAG TPA: 16S rRNA (adenine(1518)-N(6)/adenine(1519)-N(6))-dimethyltransferase RsmA [Patescibacteria group bacterium]|nr:16S rRNA (adenine(1518)-N(6)/adenine(1519)-N(6))-dimethyltransferase RsmA [Patescibacteria group bacterium]